jgi:GNAT superfamily N-acetyltransferase
MNVSWTFATRKDAPTLARWNFQLIRDERHRNAMDVPALTERMIGWLEQDYKAVIFSADDVHVGYALFQKTSAFIHLRQFFVRPDQRRRGYGSECFRILREAVFSKDMRLTIDVLAGNPAGILFWKAMGVTDYSVTLEIMPGGLR